MATITAGELLEEAMRLYLENVKEESH